MRLVCDRAAVLSVFLLFSAVGTTWAQLGRCAPRSYVGDLVEFCEPYLGELTYLPAGLPRWMIEGFVGTKVKAATRKATLVPASCQRFLIAVACMTGLPHCRTSDDGATPPTPRPLCRSTCEEAESVCNRVAPALKIDLNCSFISVERREDPGCNSIGPDGLAPVPEFPFPECGGVLAPDPTVDPEDGIPCSLKCPPPKSILHPTRASFDWAVRVLVPVCLFLLTLLLACQIYQRHKWFRFPRVCTTVCVLIIIVALMGFLIGAMRGGSVPHSCENRTKLREGDAGSVLQALVLTFAAIWQWTVLPMISTTIILVLVWRGEALERRFGVLKWVFGVAFLVPAPLVVIVTGATGTLGYANGGGLILYKSVDLGVDPDTRESVLPDIITNFVIVWPFTLAIAYSYASVVVIAILVWRMGRARLLLKQRRLFGFLVAYSTSLLLAVITFWIGILRRNRIIRASREYYECETQRWINTLWPLRVGEEEPPELVCHDSDDMRIGRFWTIYTNGYVAVVAAVLLLFFFVPDCWEIHRRGSKGSESGSTSPAGGSTGPAGMTNSTSLADTEDGTRSPDAAVSVPIE